MTGVACFDVLGTCFGFEPAIETISNRLGTKLATVNADPKSVFFSWFFAAQRDFTYASLAGSYKPIAEILKHTLRRACFVVDLPADQITDDDVTAVMSEMMKLPSRPGLKRCFDGLRAAGWDVYGVTNGGLETSLGYYHRANIELETDHLLSCDTIQVAKPDPKVYAVTNEHLTARGHHKDRWFIAAHAWDLMAARKAGFKTAFLEFEEHDPVPAVYGEFDVIAKDMEDLLAQLSKV